MKIQSLVLAAVVIGGMLATLTPAAACDRCVSSANHAARAVAPLLTPFGRIGDGGAKRSVVRPAGAVLPLPVSSVANLYVDTTVWFPREETMVEEADIELVTQSGAAFLIVMSQTTFMPLDSLVDGFMEGIDEAMQRTGKPTTSDRVVNGLQTRVVEFSGLVDGIELSYMVLFYSGMNGAVQVIGFAPTEVYAEARPVLEDALHGLSRQ